MEMIHEGNFRQDNKPVVFTNRKVVKRSSEVVWPEGNFLELKSYIDGLQAEYGKYVSWSLSYEWSGYEDCNYFVDYEEWETDEEMQSRIQREKDNLKRWETILNKRNAAKNAKANKEKEERRKQFEALKKEFGQ